MARETALERVQRLSRELEEAEADLERELAATDRHARRAGLRVVDGDEREASRWGSG